MTLAETEYADSADSELLQRIKAKDWINVQSILNNDPESAKLPDVYDNLPLHAAIGYQAPTDVLLAVFQAYPEATRVHGTDDWLPLHIAAMWGVSAPAMEALIRAHPQALDDSGQPGSIKGRTPRHFSGRFQHNTALLERSTEDWIRVIEADKQETNP